MTSKDYYFQYHKLLIYAGLVLLTKHYKITNFAAMPVLLKFDTRGLPSLSTPPVRVSPITEPSFLVRFTMHEPRSSSAYDTINCLF